MFEICFLTNPSQKKCYFFLPVPYFLKLPSVVFRSFQHEYLEEFICDPNQLSWNIKMQQLFSDATGTKYLNEEQNKEMKEINFLFAGCGIVFKSKLNQETGFRCLNMDSRFLFLRSLSRLFNTVEAKTEIFREK